MTQLRRSRWWWAMAVGALALLLLAVFVMLRQPVAAQPSLVEARRLWMLQTPARYQLTLTQQTSRGICKQAILVDGESAVELSNDCSDPTLWTVPRLFSWIAELERDQTRCYPSTTMCACYGVSTTVVRYDAARGFPQEVQYEWYKRPNLVSGAYYRSLFDRSFPGCNKDGTGGPVQYTIELSDAP
jgi:hypothetical protein